MKKWLFALLFFSRSAFAFEINPFEQAALSSEPSAYVEGNVNALTGDFMMRHLTLTVQAAEPITINLQYASPYSNPYFMGWSFQANVSLLFDPQTFYVQCLEKNGINVLYFLEDYKRCIKEVKSKPVFETKKGKSKRHDHNNHIMEAKNANLLATIDKRSYEKGICHCPYQDVSGRLNLKNNQVLYNHNQKLFTIFSPSGEVRFYKKASRQPDKISKKNPEIIEDVQLNPTNKKLKIYLLSSEKLPNGNQRLYEYDKFNHLKKIQTTNSDGTKIYAWVEFNYLKKSTRSRSCNISTSDGKVIQVRAKAKRSKVSKEDKKDVDYHVVNRICFVKWPGLPPEKYTYRKYKICERVRPDNHAQRIKYYGKKSINDLGFHQVKINKYTDRRYGRVLSLESPVGQNGEYCPTSRFLYYPKFKKGWASTEYFDLDENKTLFRYKDDLRLYEILTYQKEDNNSHCKKKITFSWGKEGSEEATFLLAKTLWEGDSTPVFSQRYFYDKHGNVIQEKIFGNLSGLCRTSLCLDSQNIPMENGIETFARKRTFSDDGKNLLLQEEDDSGLCTKISYLGNTDLVQSQLLLFKGEIKSRTFFEYNQDNILIRTINDDGKSIDKSDLFGVTERKITQITPRKDTPFLGMPACIEEYYLELETGKEQRLSRKDLFYSFQGFIEREDFYDSNNEYRYSIHITYDKDGHPLIKTNPLGERQIREYDENFQEIFFQDFGGQLSQRKKYDPAGRVIENTMKGIDGITHVNSYRYDKKSRLISSRDFLNHETRFVYSLFGELIREEGPQIPNEEKRLCCPTKVMRYDALGKKIETLDERGNVTRYKYNSFNDPTRIEYADGSFETFVYNLDRTVKSHTDQLGTKIEYEYDCLKRVTFVRTVSKEGELLSEETSGYNAFHLTETKDAKGTKTLYLYDGAGREIRETIADSVREFSYDSLGRKYKEMQHVPSGDIITFEKKDLLDRVIEERVENEEGTITYLERCAYDTAGNKISSSQFILGKECKTLYQYDSFDRLVKKVDPLGNVSLAAYDESYKDGFSQNNLRKIITDPLGRKKVESFDALGKVVSIEKFAKDETLLSHDEFTYDLTGNVRKELRWVISDGTKLSEQVTVFEYDSMNRKITQMEGAFSKYPKTTSFRYDQKGHLILQHNPSNIELLYEYDSLERKTDLYSSDNKIHYRYIYDRVGDLLESIDCLTGKKTRKEYDAQGRMISERLSNGLQIENSYDPVGRKTSMVLPDYSSIFYDYECNRLIKITKTSIDGTEYSHRFTDFDESGNCVQEEMIGGLGKIHSSFSPLGLLTALSFPCMKQKAKEIDATGKILKLKTSSSLYQEEVTYVYDDLDHLIAEKEGFFPHEYSCDSLDNRLCKDGKNYHVNELNELVFTENRQYDYDPNGNPSTLELKNQTLQMEYDPLDRLKSVTISQKMRFVYEYDAEHRRISKETYIWDNGWAKTSELQYLYDGDKGKRETNPSSA